MGFKDLLHSEKAWFAGGAILLAIVGGVVGVLSWDQVYSFSKIALLAYVSGKTAQGIADKIKSKQTAKDIELLEGAIKIMNEAIDERIVKKFPEETVSK